MTKRKFKKQAAPVIQQDTNYPVPLSMTVLRPRKSWPLIPGTPGTGHWMLDLDSSPLNLAFRF